MSTIFGTSTAAFFERSLMDLTALRKQAEETQAEMSSGERLQRSSDDPVAASRLRQLARADVFDDIDTAATNRAAIAPRQKASGPAAAIASSEAARSACTSRAPRAGAAPSGVRPGPVCTPG